MIQFTRFPLTGGWSLFISRLHIYYWADATPRFGILFNG